MKRTIVLLFILFLYAGAAPQPARSFKKTMLDSLKQDPALQYKEAPGLLESIFSDLMAWLAQKLAPYMTSKTARLWIRIAGYLAALLTIGVIIYYFVKGDKSALFGKQESVPQAAASISSDDIYNLDLQELLQDAVQDGRLRDAVRLLYLIGLKSLADRGDLKWRKGKTNHDYLNDLRDKENLYTTFRELTRSYEFIWYGRTEIEADTFEQLKERFTAIIPETVHA